MRYTDALIQRAKNSSDVLGVRIAGEGGLYRLPFPLPEPLALLSAGRENRAFLVGSDDPLVEESIEIRVICSEGDGMEACAAAASELCAGLMLLDEEKRITGFSLAGYSFNNELLCYEAGITVHLREYNSCGGEDDQL